MAKENAKVTDWIAKKLDMSAEVAQEESLVEMRDDEIAMEAYQPNPEMIERMAKRDRQQEYQAFLNKQNMNKLSPNRMLEKLTSAKKMDNMVSPNKSHRNLVKSNSQSR